MGSFTFDGVTDVSRYGPAMFSTLSGAMAIWCRYKPKGKPPVGRGHR